MIQAGQRPALRGYSAGAARTVEYRYDDIYRLTKESITTSSGWERTISYTYDAVGNRGTMRTETATERIDVTYAYAERDRCGSTVGRAIARRKRNRRAPAEGRFPRGAR